MRKIIISLPVISAFWFIGTIVIGGINQPSYLHMSQFISELGANGATNGQMINLVGFIPTSVFLTIFVFLAIYLSPKKTNKVLGLLGIGVYAITLSIAALYPCDVGCRPNNPSTSQIVHNLSAIIGYLSGIGGVFLLASEVKQKGNNVIALIGYSLGSLAVVMVIFLSPEFSFVGLVQRVFELSIYTWIILYSFTLQIEIRRPSF